MPKSVRKLRSRSVRSVRRAWTRASRKCIGIQSRAVSRPVCTGLSCVGPPSCLDATVADRDRALDPLGDARVVRHQHDRVALVVQRAQQGEDLVAGARVEVAGRLVGEDQARPADQRARDRDALALAAGELGGQMARARARGRRARAPPAAASRRSRAGTRR